MRIERLGEKAVILRDLPCPAFGLARMLNEMVDLVNQANPTLLLNTNELQRLEEAVASYDTVGLYFSRLLEDLTAIEHLSHTFSIQLSSQEKWAPNPKLIPVCYELGPDLANAAQKLGIPPEELIDIHLGTVYQCYAVGFSPGFAYLGYLDDRIATLPRLASPRPRVEPGSVGITGRQTAVYPSATPGGWNLIGKCPLKLVDVEDSYFPIEAGDQVRFKRISEAEFGHLEGERL